MIKKNAFLNLRFLTLITISVFSVYAYSHPNHGFGGGNPFVYYSPAPKPINLIEAIIEYFVLGFEHILPKGLDHILFVLGIFLLSKSFKSLLIQITLFTVAHSITLAMSILSIIELPAYFVEPLIALSIVYIAVENLTKYNFKRLRPFVILIFGFLHGFGFAGVLSELGLPKEQFLTALLSFNFGVEMGQLAVIGIAYSFIGVFKERTWYFKRVIQPMSLFIASVGAFWIVERVFF